jgi:hypothetical protein
MREVYLSVGRHGTHSEKKNLLFFIGPAHSKEKHQLAIKSAQGRGCQEHFFKNYEQRF